MRHAAAAARAVVDLAWTRLRRSDQFRNRARRKLRIGDDRERRNGNAHDRFEIAWDVVPRVFVQARVDDVVDTEHDQRVAVGDGLGNGGGTDVARGARLVLDNHALPPRFGQSHTEHAGRNVRGRTGRERDDDLDGLVGIRLAKSSGARNHRGRKQEDQRALHQSTFAPEASIILEVFSISFLMKAPNSSGVDP